MQTPWSPFTSQHHCSYTLLGFTEFALPVYSLTLSQGSTGNLHVDFQAPSACFFLLFFPLYPDPQIPNISWSPNSSLPPQQDFFARTFVFLMKICTFSHVFNYYLFLSVSKYWVISSCWGFLWQIRQGPSSHESHNIAWETKIRKQLQHNSLNVTHCRKSYMKDTQLILERSVKSFQIKWSLI